MFCKVEDSRLAYIRNNQAEIRADLYNNAEETIEDNDIARSGVRVHRVILPSSFIGSPRDQKNKYLDTMAYTRSLGLPHHFITMTCNPNWIEIQRELLPGQKANDRPDLCTRVFNMKQKALIEDLKAGAFGVCTAHVAAIEFQKRGLPHAHIVIWLAARPQTDDIDGFVSAEIPDPVTHPRLHAAVKRHMLHTCNEMCTSPTGCKKHFPKPFAPVTTHGELDTRVTYRRRGPEEGGHTVTKAGVVYDNSRVVPFNAQLLLKYDCHINVEVCTSVGAIKYLFKYVHKGPDRQRIQLRRAFDAAGVPVAQVDAGEAGAAVEVEEDEIALYLDARYLGPCEACWRLFGFKLLFRSHTVVRLIVHLDGFQRSPTMAPRLGR
jgi:hypothetical protein